MMFRSLFNVRACTALSAVGCLALAATQSAGQNQIPVGRGEGQLIGQFAAQEDAIPDALPQVWRRLGAMPAEVMAGEPWVRPERFASFALDFQAMRAALAAPPLQQEERIADAPVIEIPLPDGTLGLFHCVESPILGPELQAKHTEIRTYAVWSVHDRSVNGRIDQTPLGFHAIIGTPEGTFFVDPVTRDDTVHHVSYFRDDFRSDKQFHCSAEGEAGAADAHANRGDTEATGNARRVYRLAVATTGEYSAFYGNTETGVFSGVVTTINRVNFVYIRELAVSLSIVSFVGHYNAATDPFTDGNPDAMLEQNQATLDSIVGSANYDIGHVLSIGGGGLAGLGVVCNSSFKAYGVTGSGNPVGDPFDIDYVAHEIGHQFGADHTFNGSGSFCGLFRVEDSAYEPGSGSTIMSYAGICGIEDLQGNSDAYFHARSYEQIQAYIASGGSCAFVNTSVANGISSVNAGPDYIIPARTQFTLTATGTDPDGDALTFTWEQYDLGPASTVSAPDSGSGPIFRSRLANTTGQRTFPLTTTVGGSTTIVGDRFPLTSRTMNFRATVRDNWQLAGSVNSDDMTVTTVGTAGPFRITSPNTGGTFVANSLITCTWDVAGTNTAPINVSQVRLLVSTDGGLTFPIQSSPIPNSGSSQITLPDFSSQTNVRLKIEAVGNIFFDIADQDIVVVPRVAAPTNVTASVNPVCVGSSTQLSASVPPDHLVQWFTGSCGETFIGGNSPLAVSPSTTTTYFARAFRIGDGRVSECVPVTVVVDQQPLVDNMWMVDRAGFCAGDTGTITLEVSGGVGSTVTWFEFPSFAFVGNGNPLTIPSPERTTQYLAARSNVCGQASFGLVGVVGVNSADIDRDGEITFGDFLQFFNCYDNVEPCAETDGSEGIEFGDFLTFFNGYDAGC